MGTHRDVSRTRVEQHLARAHQALYAAHNESGLDCRLDGVAEDTYQLAMEVLRIQEALIAERSPRSRRHCDSITRQTSPSLDARHRL